MRWTWMPARAYRGVPLCQVYFYALWSGVYMEVSSGGSSRCRPCSWKVRRWRTHSVPCAIESSCRAAVASLEYVMAGWLRSRRFTVASLGAGRGWGGLRPQALPRHGGGLEPGDFLPAGGRLGRRGGGRPWLHSGESLAGCLVLRWALFSGVRSLMGRGLLSSKMWLSGLSGALLPWSSSVWRCQVTRFCTPLLGTSSWRCNWIVPSHRIQSPVWSLRKGCWTFVPFSNSGLCFGLGQCWWREGG